MMISSPNILPVKPLTVQIANPPSSLVADRRYEVTCESSGSRPNAIITWYKGKRQLKRAREETFVNRTKSILNFVPTTEDDKKTITCRGESPFFFSFYQLHYLIKDISF